MIDKLSNVNMEILNKRVSDDNKGKEINIRFQITPKYQQKKLLIM